MKFSWSKKPRQNIHSSALKLAREKDRSQLGGDHLSHKLGNPMDQTNRSEIMHLIDFQALEEECNASMFGSPKSIRIKT
jgi:hypothetical protein